jgi:hypothetical protein
MQRARLCTCLGLALALLPASLAQAEIGPVPKPGAVVAPVAKPKTTTHVTPAKRQPPPTQPVVHQTPVSHAPAHTTPPAPAVASGGRDQPALSPVAPVAATGGRFEATSLPARIAELLPTRLAEVGDDSLPSYDSWPSWVLAAFTLLASAEAFLLVRLARARRYAHGERLRQLTDH